MWGPAISLFLQASKLSQRGFYIPLPSVSNPTFLGLPYFHTAWATTGHSQNEKPRQNGVVIRYLGTAEKYPALLRADSYYTRFNWVLN